MERSDESIEHLEAQLTVVRWHLDALQPDGGDGNQRHLEAAREAFESALELLARATLLGSRRVQVLMELSELRDRMVAPEEKSGTRT
jgi:hypothetical protein